MKNIIIILVLIINFTVATIAQQYTPEDKTPLSMLPFDYDTFCREKLDHFWSKKLDTEVFRECLLSDTTELGKIIASQLQSSKTTYMVLSRNENFTLYFFLLSREIETENERIEEIGIEEHQYLIVNALATINSNGILSVLEQPLNYQGNKFPTFTVTPDLTINIYNARLEDILGWKCPVKEDKITTYIIDNNGTFSQYK